MRRVEAEGGSVLAATPEPVTNPDGTQQRSRTLQFAELELTPRDIHVTVVPPGGSRGWFRVTADHHIFDHDHEYVGTIDQLVAEFLSSESVRHFITTAAIDHAESGDLKSFSVADTAMGRHLFLQWTPPDSAPPEWHRLEELAVSGDFAREQIELTFDVFRMRDRSFGTAVRTWRGQDLVFVATNQTADKAVITWRPTP